MSGKPYQQREMKSIVDYLVEHRFYNETKGRKMWMDYAESKLTTRTWQSLKETFLKRILPDITNPYYRLDPDQILSFKRGLDLTQKDKKLEFKAVNDSVNNGTNGDNQQPSTSKDNKEENATGEDTQCSKIVHDRASTETLVLDTYRTAEDIERELQNTDEESDKDKAKTKTKPVVKSVRDFIEYSEPLTPMLQEVLDDFATDEDGSDSENPMQIDENYIAQEQIAENSKIVASQSILQPKPKDTPAGQTKIEGKKNMDKTENEKQVIEHKEESVKPTDDTVFTQLEDVMVLVDEALAKDLDKELNSEKVGSLNVEGNSHHSSSTLTDSLLPNNQEAVQNSASTVAAQSPALSTPSDNRHQGDKEKTTELDINSLNSKTHLISDEEQDKVPSKNPNTESNKESDSKKEIRKKPKMTLIKHATNTTSPKSPNKPLGDGEILEAHSNSVSASNQNENVKFDNPCLQSVSLYAEQLTATKYSDSETNNTETAMEPPKASVSNVENNDETVGHKRKADRENGSEDHRNKEAKPADNVILLHSRTTSESVDDSLTNHRPLARSSLKKQKDKKLASVFGFSNGGGAKSRRLGSRKRTISHRNLPSESSDWTSASDSEYVSPPHGRRNRYARKYLKPHSARIMSLDEGGLFVMLGRKVYPLVKDGRAMKNFVTYLPESDPEEDDSYWKSKYIEERKQTAELKKKLGQTNGVVDKTDKERSISLSSPLSEIPPKVRISRQGSLNGTELMRRESGTGVKAAAKQETLKIKFTKKGQEVQLEGHWQDINPVLEQVVSMFHKDAEPKKADVVTFVELSSGETTPIIPPNAGPRDKGVHEKINEMESAIFKQIEEHDVDESGEQNKDHNVMETNGRDNISVEKDREINIPVTEGQESAPSEKAIEENIEEEPRITLRKKRGRPKKEASPALAVAQSPAKRQRKSSSKPKELKAQETEDSTPNLTRQTRTPRKLLDGVPTKAKTTRKSTAKAQLLKPVEPVEDQETPAEDPEEEVRYKFPSPVPENIDINSNDPSKEHLPNITSPDSLSRHSVNSSQGYQDSDTSPFNIGKRRKRRLSIPTSFKGRKAQRALRRNSYPLLKQIDSESSNPSFVISMKTISREQSTLNSEVYRSESYQFLMPRTRSIVRTLEKIDEVACKDNDTLMDQIRDLRNEMLRASDPAHQNDAASSSTLSLPLSPELSIVENLSISKSILAAIDDPTINEIQANDVLKACDNQYLISAVDVSMPLMAQNCALREGYKKHIMSALSNLSDTPNSAGRNFSFDSNMGESTASEFILKNVSVVNIANSDSLDRRLEQLLLESAQKPVNENGSEKMEVDTVVKKKSGSRKRCSTPHKKTVQNKKKITEEPIIEEESKAHCARGGRRSCPPSVNIVYYENNAPDNLEINIHDKKIDVTAVTKSKRVKKDVIKVKIVRPKAKPQRKSKNKTKTPDVSQTSENTEADNESGVFLQAFEDSGDLIHNHSETCLQIGECMGDSVEFIETTTKSIISLSSSSLSADSKEKEDVNSTESEKMAPDAFCDNAQCAVHLRDAQVTVPNSIDSGNTVYFTPFVSRSNSVVTEDLSDAAPTKQTNRNSKWYLLSDEEESISNYFDIQENDSPSYGANLQKLFPITCAVPDLSTITEMSGNESSQKTSFDEARRS